MPEVKIFSTTWCGFCRAEKRFLDERKVKYEDVDVEKDETAARVLAHLSGQMGVPFTLITKDDGSRVGIIGFDQPHLMQELGLK